MPNKTIYVSDGDLTLFQRAQELAGGNLSSAIVKALRRYVDTAEGLAAGYDDVVVRVGLGSGRKIRFTAVLVGEWTDGRATAAVHYRVWRGRTGKYVVHLERSEEFWAVDPEGRPAGWRSWIGVGDIRYGGTPKESTLEVVPDLDALRDKLPPELFEMVSRSARQPTIEDLEV